MVSNPQFCLFTETSLLGHPLRYKFVFLFYNIFVKIKDILLIKYCFYIIQTYLGKVLTQKNDLGKNLSVSETRTLPLCHKKHL